MEDSTNLTVLDQFEEAAALRGAAVKLAQAYGVDLDDVVQDMAINALEIKDAYGFEHVNTIVNRTRDNLTSYNYGVNRYYREQGVAEVSVDQYEYDDDDTSWVVAFADESFDWDRVDTRLSVEATLGELPTTQRQIAQGLMQGMTGRDIAVKVGVHETTVSSKKHNLREAFAWAVA